MEPHCDEVLNHVCDEFHRRMDMNKALSQAALLYLSALRIATEVGAVCHAPPQHPSVLKRIYSLVTEAFASRRGDAAPPSAPHHDQFTIDAVYIVSDSPASASTFGQRKEDSR